MAVTPIPTKLMADYLYPAFESGMGETLVRETDDQVLDNDELWQRAIRLQRLLDRVQGLA